MQEQFLRVQMLFGADAVAALQQSHVAVFGLGGVGSYAVEALVRSGVGELTLVDDDVVSISNLNRRSTALYRGPEQGGRHRRALPRHQSRCDPSSDLWSL